MRGSSIIAMVPSSVQAGIGQPDGSPPLLVSQAPSVAGPHAWTSIVTCLTSDTLLCNLVVDWVRQSKGESLSGRSTRTATAREVLLLWWRISIDHGVEPAAWSKVQASRPGSRPRLALFASRHACDSRRRDDASRRCLYNPPQGVSARRVTGDGVSDAEHEARDQRTTGPSHAGRPGGTRPPDRAGAAAGRDGRTAAGSALPPRFEADRYRVDDHNVRLKAQRQVDQSCLFLA
jgi:hypothetical protein